MSYKVTLDKLADIVKEIIINKGEGLEIETEDFGWNNYRYVSNHFRIAHIERYSDKNLEVLHITTFPNNNSPNPIFGFDVITTDKKPLAAFLDYSPTISKVTYKPNIIFNTLYNLPDWAKNIFSEDAIAIIPSEGDLSILAKIVEEAYSKYLDMCVEVIPSTELDLIKNHQNYYCEQQQKNERTFNVLKAKLGEDRARYFMSTILFPKIT